MNASTNLDIEENNNTSIAINRLSDDFTNIILVLYAFVFTLGIVGNVFACAVVVFKHTMRRSIHFYTCNLSISDILILLVYAPTQMRFINDHLNWKMGKITCKLANFIIPLSLQASICTLVAISIDRFRGVVYPFSWRVDSMRNAKIIIPLTWIFSIIIAFPTGYYATTVLHPNNTQLIICWENLPESNPGDSTFQLTYWTIVMILEYILPFFIIAIVHLYMAKRIANGGKGVSAFHRRMMIMVILLLTVYLICTGMQHIYFYIAYFNRSFGTSPSAGYLYVISNFLIVLQAAVNPLIYCTTRSDFKDAYKDVIKKLIRVTRMRFLLNKESNTLDIQTVTKDKQRERINVTPLLIQKLERDRSDNIALDKFQEISNDDSSLESSNEDDMKSTNKPNRFVFNRLNSIQTALKTSHANKFKFNRFSPVLSVLKSSDSKVIIDSPKSELLHDDVSSSDSNTDNN